MFFRCKYPIRDAAGNEILPAGTIVRMLDKETPAPKWSVQPIGRSFVLEVEHWLISPVCLCPVCGTAMNDYDHYDGDLHMSVEYGWDCPQECYVKVFAYGGYKTVCRTQEITYSWQSPEEEQQWLEAIIEGEIARQRRYLYE